ncbi:hypothetical protein CLV59_10161 [Chitinophaga dinghuensis]|uniref:Cellulase (Glycosyl hydrolase family 5) n=1 Tax=Chitinophaga dinghuensis TaxID=1539050 RepID=A0A327WBV2_9BACT|nr:1,4-beta-xylanase [Chitinophaga dinghuensis]RAJ87312.1 hypothetical protein CLV59_10161 [Chitinophaga dinghuensis]
MQKTLILFTSLFVLLLSACSQERPVWTLKKANDWYAARGWMSGVDFIPSSAVNQLEMWQAATFDSAGIDRELDFAAGLGFNAVRVYLHHLPWVEDATGFKKRMDTYLSIANSHKIGTIFVFFDDCWNDYPHSGQQPAPKPGIHNSGWVRDPGSAIFHSAHMIDTLESYVKDVLGTFKDDKRIIMWDLYNEPGNSGYGDSSRNLLTQAFRWGRQVNPVQPLTSGVWAPALVNLNKLQLEKSDIITYHNYQNERSHQGTIDSLRKFGRPLICTEYMARTHGSRFENILPMLKDEKVGAISWGLVDGKTNTKYAWNDPIPSGEEPKVWFHDILHKNGFPYDSAEVRLIKEVNGVKQ